MSSRPAANLPSLPHELLLQILQYLDLPDLVAISRTCRALRPLPLDPLLHRRRLHVSSAVLEHFLPLRPSLSSLRPPSREIYLTPTLFTRKKILRNLIGIKLARRLRQRPSVRELVGRGVLPGECVVLVKRAERPAAAAPADANQAPECACTTSAAATGGPVHRP
jgi:hypothetical protein